MIDLIDLTCPTPKDKLEKTDKVIGTDGENVFLVPSENVGGGGGGDITEEITDMTNGLVGIDTDELVGSLSVEEFIVAKIAIEALSDYEDFTNIYSDKIDVNSIAQKLRDRYLVPTQPILTDMEFGPIISSDGFEVRVRFEAEVDSTIPVYNLELQKKLSTEPVESYQKMGHEVDYTKLSIDYSLGEITFTVINLKPETTYDIKVVYRPTKFYYKEDSIAGDQTTSGKA